MSSSPRFAGRGESSGSTGYAFDEIAQRRGDFAIGAAAAAATVAPRWRPWRRSSLGLRRDRGSPDAGRSLRVRRRSRRRKNRLRGGGASRRTGSIRSRIPKASAAYRRQLVRVLGARVLERAFERAGAPSHAEDQARRRSRPRDRHRQRQGAAAATRNRGPCSAISCATSSSCSEPMSAASTAFAARARSMIDGRAVRSCLRFAVQADGAVIGTVEGLAKERDAEPVAGGVPAGATRCNAVSARRAS